MVVWCPPCKQLAPVLEEFAGETSEARIFKVNVGQCPELARQYRIQLIPALLVFRNGALTERHIGLADKATLEELLRSHSP